MVDWTKSMKQEFEYYEVDPYTWKDVKPINNIKSSTINRDYDAETLGSATIDINNSLGECYIRIYLITIQNGIREKHPLGTFLVQTPNSSFDGKVRSVSMDAYTPLLELKENKPPLGYSLLKDDNIMSEAFKIVREHCRAPVIETESDKKLLDNFVANSDDTWIKYVIDYENDVVYISSNYRWIIENNLENWLQYLCEPTEFHKKRVTVRFIADIHFYKDTTRHRVFSWAIESTRFCNYMKEKFKMSVSFMKPTWIREEDIPELEEDCRTIESIYFKWINKGYQAQHAAYFLPQGTKAEVIMTGFQSDYRHFFDLRARGTTGAPHPDVKALVEPVYKTFIERDYI